MSELRVDPLTGLRAIVARERLLRPGGDLHAEPPEPVDPDADPFLEGHEDRTPPELDAVARPGSEGRAPDTPGWLVRVVPNRFPALTRGAHVPPAQEAPDLFTAVAAEGEHEVVVNAPEPVQSLGECTAEQVQAAVGMWARRIAHHREAGAACVHLIVNQRREAGSSLPHTHAQVYALDFVPAAIARERERFGAHAVRTMGGNLLGDLVQEEVRRRERVVAVDDEAVLLAPYASRLPYQLMLAPRRPRPRFEDGGPTGAGLLHDALGRLARRLGAHPPLNLWVRTAPDGADRFCWRIDIVPRLTHLAGLELGAGLHICTVPPETAAAELRDAGG